MRAEYTHMDGEIYLPSGRGRTNGGQWWTISQHQEAAEGTRFAGIIETNPKLCICGEAGQAENGQDPQTRKFRT